MKPIKVSQLNRYIKTVLQTDPVLGNVSVVGEVSNLKYHGSGHVYFSLKDSFSRVNCFLPSDQVKYLRYPLEDGMEIVASGYLSVYEKGGTYSLFVGDISVQGRGNLAEAFERMRKRLAAQGLFDSERKKTLPKFPKTVAIVTSETGAVVRDIIRTIKNKNDFVDIIVFPCLVQGDGAAKEIAGEIGRINAEFPWTDVMIVGRGGGSMEELWPFNEEIVARAIADSACPVISAVGHETDVTIADFAADYRAATPTAAAEAAVPDTGMLRENLREILSQMRRTVQARMELYETRLSAQDPRQMKLFLMQRIREHQSRLQQLNQEMHACMRDRIHHQELRLQAAKSAIEELDPKRLMEMGYGAVTDSQGIFIKTVSGLKPGDAVQVTMRDGTLYCRTEHIEYRDRSPQKKKGIPHE